MSKYLPIPTELIKSGVLTHTELFIFIEICNLTELEKGCIASNNHFADLLGMTVKSVSNIISSLNKKGFIKTEIEKGTRNQIRRIFTIHNLGNYYPQNMDTPSIKYGESKENKRINKINNSSKPTLEEISAYIKEKKYNVNPIHFFEYYEAENWKSVKNWKQKVITWSGRSKNVSEVKTDNTINSWLENNGLSHLKDN